MLSHLVFVTFVIANTWTAAASGSQDKPDTRRVESEERSETSSDPSDRAPSPRSTCTTSDEAPCGTSPDSTSRGTARCTLTSDLERPNWNDYVWGVFFGRGRRPVTKKSDGDLYRAIFQNVKTRTQTKTNVEIYATQFPRLANEAECQNMRTELFRAVPWKKKTSRGYIPRRRA